MSDIAQLQQDVEELKKTVEGIKTTMTAVLDNLMETHAHALTLVALTNSAWRDDVVPEEETSTSKDLSST